MRMASAASFLTGSWIPISPKKTKAHNAKMKKSLVKSEKIRKRLLELVDLDAKAYLGIVKTKNKSARLKKAAFKKANPILLEPVMKVEVITPENFMGDVVGDLNSKRGQIEEMTDRGRTKVISAKVPLAGMFGYATELRSMSQGRASYSMEFDHYAEVPPNVAAEIMGEDKKTGRK